LADFEKNLKKSARCRFWGRVKKFPYEYIILFKAENV